MFDVVIIKDYKNLKDNNPLIFCLNLHHRFFSSKMSANLQKLNEHLATRSYVEG